MKTKLGILSLALFFAISASAATTAYTFKKDNGKLKFLAVGRPSLMKINGKGDGPEGTLTLNGDVLDGKLTVELESLQTGIKLRDHHLKEKYLKVQDNPQAFIEFKKYKITPTEGSEQKFSAPLTMNGQTKDVSGTFSMDKSGKLQAKFELNIEDFKVPVPEYSGITVTKTVAVEVESQAEKK